MLPWQYRLYFWGVHGIFAEVVFTGVWEFLVTGRWSLMGVSSMWSFFIYSFGTMLGELTRGQLVSRRVPLLARCFVYVLITYAWEFSWGVLLSYFDARSWDYTDFDYDVMGLITMEYAPAWFFAGLYFECIYSVMEGLEQIPAWKKRLSKES